MTSFEDVLARLNPADKAWVGNIGPRKYNWTVEDIIKAVRKKTGEEVEPTSVAKYLRSKGFDRSVQHPECIELPGKGLRMSASKKKEATLHESRNDMTQLCVHLDPEILAEIEDFRFTNRCSSRVEAIRTLIREGLNAMKKNPK